MSTYAAALRDGGVQVSSNHELDDEQKSAGKVDDFNVLRSLSFGGLQLAVHVDTNDTDSNVIGSPHPESNADQSKMSSSWMQPSGHIQQATKPRSASLADILLGHPTSTDMSEPSRIRQLSSTNANSQIPLSIQQRLQQYAANNPPTQQATTPAVGSTRSHRVGSAASLSGVIPPTHPSSQLPLHASPLARTQSSSNSSVFGLESNGGGGSGQSPLAIVQGLQSRGYSGNAASQITGQSNADNTDSNPSSLFNRVLAASPIHRQSSASSNSRGIGSPVGVTQSMSGSGTLPPLPQQPSRSTSPHSISRSGNDSASPLSVHRQVSTSPSRTRSRANSSAVGGPLQSPRAVASTQPVPFSETLESKQNRIDGDEYARDFSNLTIAGRQTSTSRFINPPVLNTRSYSSQQQLLNGSDGSSQHDANSSPDSALGLSSPPLPHANQQALNNSADGFRGSYQSTHSQQSASSYDQPQQQPYIDYTASPYAGGPGNNSNDYNINLSPYDTGYSSPDQHSYAASTGTASSADMNAVPNPQNFVYMLMPNGQIQAIQLPPQVLQQLQMQQQILQPPQQQPQPQPAPYAQMHAMQQQQSMPTNHRGPHPVSNHQPYIQQYNRPATASAMHQRGAMPQQPHMVTPDVQAPYVSPLQSPNTLASFNWAHDASQQAPASVPSFASTPFSASQTPLTNPALVNDLMTLGVPLGPNGEVSTQNLVLLAKTQAGSRLLQSKLNNVPNGSAALNTPTDIAAREYFEVILAAIFPSIGELMVDLFGNYLCQRLVQLSTAEQRLAVVRHILPDFPTISCDRQGTRAIQKLVEACETRQEQQIIIDSLSGFLPNKSTRTNPYDHHSKDKQYPKLLHLIRDPNGSHVIHAMLDHFPILMLTPIIKATTKAVRSLGIDQHGLCILKKCMVLMNGVEFSYFAYRVLEHVLEYVNNQYGNYLIQHLVERLQGNENAQDEQQGSKLHHTLDSDKKPATLQSVQYDANIDSAALYTALYNGLRGHYAQLSRQKFSSNVVEKMLRINDTHIRSGIISELCETEVLQSLLACSYGNYVVQNVLYVASPEQSRLIYSRIAQEHVLSTLRRPIRQKWERLLAAAGPYQQQASGSNAPSSVMNPSSMQQHAQPSQHYGSHAPSAGHQPAQYQQFQQHRSSAAVDPDTAFGVDKLRLTRTASTPGQFNNFPGKAQHAFQSHGASAVIHKPMSDEIQRPLDNQNSMEQHFSSALSSKLNAIAPLPMQRSWSTPSHPPTFFQPSAASNDEAASRYAFMAGK